MFCSTCGKEINDNAIICPHCGCGVNPQQQAPKSETPLHKVNGLCLTGFILSLVSLLLSLYCTIPIAALVFSIVGVVQAKRRDNTLSGLGVAGIAISAVSLFLGFVLLVLGLSLLSL